MHSLNFFSAFLVVGFWILNVPFAQAQSWLPNEAAMRTSLAALPVPPKTYYVSPQGDDANDGLTLSKPLKTPQKAADLTEPGDTVSFLGGVYPYSGEGELLSIKKSGKPDAYITYQAAPGQTPVFSATNGWNHVMINASYLIIDGITIKGNLKNLTHEEGMADYESIINPPGGKKDFPKVARTNTNGLSIDGTPSRKSGELPPNHIIVRNCHVYETPGGGLSCMEADYVLLEKNIVHDCAWTMMFGGSGISVFHGRSLDQKMDDYKMIVRGNLSYRNRTDVPWIEVKRISDGNGIIIDDFRNTQTNSPPYVGRILVTNNICYENGGSGIHSFSSDNVDIINNTVYANNQRPELPWGNLFAGHSASCLILNNIIVSSPGGVINDNTANDNVIYANNLYFDGKVKVMGVNDLVGDPKFVDLGKRDFRLRKDSPAIDQGTNTQAPAQDYAGALRPQGGGVDIGAWESNFTSDHPLANNALDLEAIRKSFIFVAPKSEAMRGTPIVDGKIDAVWETTRKIVPAKVMRGDKMLPDSAKGITRALWDEKNLYLLTEVTDSELNAVAEKPFNQDSVEYFVNPTNAKTPGYQPEAGQYRVNFQGATSEGTNVTPQKYQAAATRTATGYIVEAAIPWQKLKPAVGTVIGFDNQVNDANAAGERIGCIVWSDPEGSGYSRTAKFGELKLTDKLSEAVQTMSAFEK